ncbi:amidase [Halalkalicoccus jeotgali]|nr:amidase family protein [Halalkalicoccus jeotgali]
MNDEPTSERRTVLKGLGAVGFGTFTAGTAGARTATDDTNHFEVIETTVAEFHSAVESGSINAEGITKRYLARIKAYDDELNSLITINTNAVNRAQHLDREYEDSGTVGPLHGVPVVLKDNHDTRDMPTTAGSVALADSLPPEDAFVVQQLREAGAIILAKANLQEFAYGVDTVSSLGGETSNAYDLNRRPSGSSGGTAAAIAANLGLLGTGSDTCSSNRSPPAFNNLVGIRPTIGLLSRSGIIPLSETQDTVGPMTRTVADAAAMLEVLAGYDPEDPVTARGATAIPDEGYTDCLNDDGLQGARIGVIRDYFDLQDGELELEEENEAVVSVLEKAIGDIEAEGATIVDSVDVIDQEFLSGARVTDLEFKRDLNAYLESLGNDAPVDSMEEILESGQIHPEVAARIEEAGIPDVDVESLGENPDYLERLVRRTEIRDIVLQTMVEQDLDALLYPPSTVPPVSIEENQPFSEMNCELSAHSGLPAIVVPAGFTGDGLPVGVELLGREFAEPRLIELAYAYEQAVQHRCPPNKFGPL